MSFLKRWLGSPKSLDGEQLARSDERREYAQIDLLAQFVQPRKVHDLGDQQRWSRTLPQSYLETIQIFEKQGWLDVNTLDEYRVTPQAMPYVQIYEQRLAAAKAEVMPKVRAALAEKQTSEALTIRRAYEAWFPLGTAGWTGPDPQLSHSALTRRIFFLDHWLLEGLSQETCAWLKLYAAEQHLWGAYWQLSPDAIPAAVQQELARPDMDAAEAAYWKAYQISLYVDNQETWQRCKGGDHVRRIEIVGPDDDYTCAHCKTTLGKEFLVARVPELPHRACISPRGCRCRYEPVLESLDELEL
jgi:hypothetical protein